jgi:serine/threonine protein kinase
MIGSTISHYKILEKLGEGGMGVVYKAQDTTLDRLVALKFLPPHVSTSSEDKARFIQEAKAAAALNHPNICTIHGIEDVDEAGNIRSFIVMEYVEGKTLRGYANAFSTKEAIEIGAQIAGGLSAAHERGIVHRDIKPENIMLRKDGRALVMDFGLAKLKGASRLTKTGSTVGTVRYMSPEQILGREIDHRSDIFSLGVLLYELFTGHSPFKGEHEAAVIYEIANVEPVPPSALKPEIRPEINALILDCLAKDPNERCQSAAELRRKLLLLSSGARPDASPMKQLSGSALSAQDIDLNEAAARRGKRWIILLSSAAGLLLCSVAVLLFNPREDSLDLSKYKFTPLATETDPEEWPSWSADGKSIVYARSVDGVAQVFYRDLEKPLPSQLTNLRQDVSTFYSLFPFWSPDGKLVYYLSEDTLYTISPAGGEPKKVLGPALAAAISPDGKTIAFLRANKRIIEGKDSTQMVIDANVFILSPGDTSVRQYRPGPTGIRGDAVPYVIHFSPDGKKIGLFTSGTDGRGSQFWILPWPDGEGAKPYRIYLQVSKDSTLYDVSPFSWMPDSRHIMLTTHPDRNLWSGDIEAGTMHKNWTPLEAGVFGLSVSHDGKKIALVLYSEDYNVIQMPLDGSRLRNVLATSRREESLSFSSDGTKSTYITNRSGDDEIWLRSNNVDVRPIVKKQDFPEHGEFVGVGNAIISPDGRRVAFVLWPEWKIYIASTDGGKPTLLMAGDLYQGNFTWSPDSRNIAVQSDVGVYVVRVGAQESQRIVPSTYNIRTAIYWSPDNKWIAYGTLDQSIVLVSPDGRMTKKIPSPEKINSENFFLMWSKDGSGIYVASSERRHGRLHLVDISTGKSRKIAEYKEPVELYTYGFPMLFGVMAPDGKSIITTARELKSDIWMLEGFPQK